MFNRGNGWITVEMCDPKKRHTAYKTVENTRVEETKYVTVFPSNILLCLQFYFIFFLASFLFLQLQIIAKLD